MDYASGERKVTVWGKPYVVLVYQSSKSVWEASGEYMGEPITVKDRTEGTALKRWIEAARYRGNL
jgi:hypothetical protein